MKNSIIKWRKIGFAGCILTLFFLVTACEIKPVEIVSIDTVKILKINKEGAELEINITLQNPNIIGFTVTGAELKGLLGEMMIGEITIKNKIKIPSHSKKTHAFKINAKIDAFINGGIGALMGLLSKGGPELKIQGNLKVRSFLISRRVPIDFTKKIPINPLDLMK